MTTPKLLCSLALLGSALLVALPAAARFQKPEDAVKYRKAAFTVMAAIKTTAGAVGQACKSCHHYYRKE